MVCHLCTPSAYHGPGTEGASLRRALSRCVDWESTTGSLKPWWVKSGMTPSNEAPVSFIRDVVSPLDKHAAPALPALCSLGAASCVSEAFPTTTEPIIQGAKEGKTTLRFRKEPVHSSSPSSLFQD